MKYKLIFIVSIVLLIFASSSQATTAPTNLVGAVSLANQEIGNNIGNYEYFTPSNVAEKTIDWIKIGGIEYVTIGNSSDTYGALVYGEPHGDTSTESESLGPSNGSGEIQYRYLGYTYLDEDYTNPAYPHDAWAGGYLEDRNWISEPWVNIEGNYPNEFDGDTKYLPNIQKGISLYYSDVSLGGNSPYWTNWSSYCHILCVPTQYTWGMGRMWHKRSDGSIWYITVPLVPGAALITPELVITPSTSTIYESETQQYTATYYPQGKQAGNGQNVTASCTWTVDDNSIAKISNTGLATGMSQGDTMITATYTVGGTTITGQAELVIEEKEEEVPSSINNGSLTFQAVSQNGKQYRDPNRAMWTDVVTATLTLPVKTKVTKDSSVDYDTTVAPPKPTERGCETNYNKITEWHIVSAELSYPTQNPKFTFGHPLDPVGVTTIPMEISEDGHTATATFKEQWAMNGANIYDVFLGKEVCTEPKNYDITVSNIVVNIDYKEYTFKEKLVFGGWDCVRSVEEKYDKQNLDLITGQLEVYGSGVNSLAQ
ncbi:MAG: Bacterial Ig-like domain (group 2) [Pelotomaculum sp. PtaU1.Bin065]|nr:MAG: Bacterial Ig-like domain (group 2) [Pelotomaculum sp. PtaU1.Bin065]